MRLIRNLQSLRGAAAVMILAHHMGFSSVMTKSFGDFAVALFFVLSGFVLTLAYHDRVRQGRPLPFLPFFNRRLLKIYPLYILTMALAWLLPGHYGGVSAILPDILMIQSWIPDMTIYFSGNAIGWFVSDIMFCYLLFLPALRLILFRRRMFHIIATSLLLLYFTIIAVVPYSSITYAIYIIPPMQFIPFLLGIYLATLPILHPDKGTPSNTDSHPPTERLTASPLRANLLIILSIALSVALMLLFPFVTKRITLASYWWLPTSCLILALTLTDNIPTPITRFLHSPLFIKAGNLSYPFFLLHLPYLSFTRLLFNRFELHITPLYEFLIAIPILFLLSHLTTRYILTPLTRHLQSTLL